MDYDRGRSTEITERLIYQEVKRTFGQLGRTRDMGRAKSQKVGRH